MSLSTLGPATASAITVFCGSSMGKQDEFAAAAKQTGVAFAKADITLVYGGGTSGIMGVVARSALEAGGRVHGVIPTAFLGGEPLDPAYLPASPSEAAADPTLRNVQSPVASMHVRKQLMADLSRAFVALPGGYGTLEEVAEMTTWTQLGIHKKPVVLLNVLGFFSPLRDFVEGAITGGFILPNNRAFLVFVDAPSDLSDFNWGTAALKAVEEWESKGLGGGVPHSLEWGSGRPVR